MRYFNGVGMEPIWRARELFHHCYNLTLSCWKLVCFDFSSSVTPNRLLSLSISSHLGRDCVRKYGQICIHTQKPNWNFIFYQISDKNSFYVSAWKEHFSGLWWFRAENLPNGWDRPRVESPVVTGLASGQPPQVDNLELEHLRSWQRWPLAPS